jgi:hypothetical protein
MELMHLNIILIVVFIVMAVVILQITNQANAYLDFCQNNGWDTASRVSLGGTGDYGLACAKRNETDDGAIYRGFECSQEYVLFTKNCHFVEDENRIVNDRVDVNTIDINWGAYYA